MYLAYYLSQMNWLLLGRFMRHTRAQSGIGSSRQVLTFLVDSLRYNISPLEWYQFRFSGIDAAEKCTWAGTGTMYEFHRQVNPPSGRAILADKRKFYRAYREFCRHGLWSIEDLLEDQMLLDRLLSKNERLVFKNALGNCGSSVRIVETAELRSCELTKWMSSNGYDMVESCIEQHPDLQALSPSGVNTVRIFTLIDRKGEYQVLGCRLRISVDSSVDNLAAGNLAAAVEQQSGVVSGPGIYSDITRSPEAIHPVTGTPINGFQLPFWQECLDLAKKASLKHPQNRSVGWDIAITSDGPDLIEGNHDWCKLVWQLPVRKGLKHLLEKA
jgi:hypothetical protein